MAVTLDKLADGRVLKLTFVDPWQMRQLTELYAVMTEYLNNSKVKVHTLVDASKMRSIPPDSLAARRSPSMMNPNSGHTVVFGASTHAKMLIDLATRISRFERLQLFETEAQAWEYLNKLLAEPVNEQAAATKEQMDTSAAKS